MQEPDHQQLHRAVANALWPYLRIYEDGETGWSPWRETRAIHPTGNPPGHRYAPGQIPGPEPTTELLGIRWGIITTLHSTDWPGRRAYRITLWRDDHDARLARLPAAAIADYQAALEHSGARKPFQLATTEDGTKRLTRNRNDGTITHLVAAALEAIADAATLRLIPPEVERQIFDAMLSDADISLTATLAALERAGGTEP